jgi:hypothetical protein
MVASLSRRVRTREYESRRWIGTPVLLLLLLLIIASDDASDDAADDAADHCL